MMLNPAQSYEPEASLPGRIDLEMHSLVFKNASLLISLSCKGCRLIILLVKSISVSMSRIELSLLSSS